MEIKFVLKNNTKFKKLLLGDTFLDEEYVMMKIGKNDMHENAVDLETGDTFYIDADKEVKKIKGKFIVEQG